MATESNVPVGVEVHHPRAEELRTIGVFADLPDDALEWLASAMSLREHDAGDIIVRQGEPADRLVAILAGEMASDRDGARFYTARAGQVTGMLPFSRLTNFPSTIRALEPMRLGFLTVNQFPEMLHRIPVLQERLVNVLTDRVRETTAALQQREKLATLGKLSAGLAHELNNPAAAVRRAADNLRKVLQQVRSAALELDKRNLPQPSRLFLARLECDLAAGRSSPGAVVLDTLERSEREEQYAEWLGKHDVAQAWDLAIALVDLGCTPETLEQLAQNVPPEFLSDVLTRLTAAFTISRLTEEIGSGAERISELVRSVKEYSYMDQMAEQEVDIHQGIENTLVMLRHSLKNGVEVVREYDRTLPLICVRGSELNQIWTNLISNAADAMGGKGTLTIRTMRDGDDVVVEVADNGPGVPAEIRERIFDPFFTTKKVGEGTGLGLDTVQRVVRNHHGAIALRSQPGDTCFAVRLPI